MKTSPVADLSPITRHFRAMYSSRLLVAAVRHFHLFDMLASGPQPMAELQDRLGLKDRPAMVLFPALCAMSLVEFTSPGVLSLTGLGRHLSSGPADNLASYIGLEGNDPGVLEMVQRLKNDGPVNPTGGTAYVKEGREASPMDEPNLARVLTLALSGRARHLSPLVAAALPGSGGHLLDVAGGTGLFAYEWLRLNPEATATVLDRPHVLTVAAEFLEEFSRSGRKGAVDIRDRVTLLPGDMLEDALPDADVVLAASVFHDWPTSTCERLAARMAQALRPRGELWVHDAFLRDSLDGPLAVTDYSAQLFWVTKGRCYSRREFRQWMSASGLTPVEGDAATSMDYGLLSAVKR